jgi:IclR helix-turn-helix domain/Transcriptional regulator, AbiEi antitoxin, Type IV TA system
MELREAAREVTGPEAGLAWRWLEDEPGDRLELNMDGRRLVFEVEFQIIPGARAVHRLAERHGSRPFLLVAPSLSETLVNQCRERGISCLDLNGRQWVRADGILVDRYPTEGHRFRPAIAVPDVFQPKSSRLARALLSQPDQEWTQTELGKRTGLSPGLVSRLIRHLVNEGFVGQQGRILRLAQPKGLLDAWAARDDWSKRTAVRQYSLLEADPEKVAQRLFETFAEAAPLVFTQWFAANLRHPYTIPPVVSAYVEAQPGENLLQKLRARPVADGGTLWLAVPNDGGVFRETRRVGPFTLACDAQIYLDLLRIGLRGPDQAKALREWEGFGRVDA